MVKHMQRVFASAQLSPRALLYRSLIALPLIGVATYNLLGVFFFFSNVPFFAELYFIVFAAIMYIIAPLIYRFGTNELCFEEHNLLIKRNVSQNVAIPYTKIQKVTRLPSVPRTLPMYEKRGVLAVQGFVLLLFGWHLEKKYQDRYGKVQYLTASRKNVVWIETKEKDQKKSYFLKPKEEKTFFNTLRTVVKTL